MGTEVLKSYSTLQSELELAKNSLKGVDENIKRLIGRDPSDLPPRPGVKRNVNQPEERGRQRGLINEDKHRLRGSRIRGTLIENAEPQIKKRVGGISVFKRLSDRPIHEEPVFKFQKQMISKVIVTPKEVPSRQEALEAQNRDVKSKERNKRMFGALLGTLQKFQQEETKLKKKEDKRAQLEKKIEDHEIKEKEEIKKERQELFFNRKRKQAEIKMIELKMLRMKEYAAWEERQKPRMNFIYTKTKPHIHFLPRRLNEANKTLLENSKTEVQKLIEKRKQQVQDELEHIEERMKRNFEPRKPKETHNNNNNNEEEHEHEHEFEDEDVVMEELPSIDEKENTNTNNEGESRPNRNLETENCAGVQEETVNINTPEVLEQVLSDTNNQCSQSEINQSTMSIDLSEIQIPEIITKTENSSANEEFLQNINNGETLRE